MFKILISLFCLTFLFHSSAKDSVDLKWGINLSPIYYFSIAANEFKDNVERRTSGRVNVKLHLSEYSQESRDHVADIVNGKYDMGQETIVNLQKIRPELALWDLPFLFKSDEQVFKFTSSKYGRKLFSDLKKKKLTAVEYTYSGGFINVFGQKFENFTKIQNTPFAMEEVSPFFSNSVIGPLKPIYRKYGDSSVAFSEIISSTTNELLDLIPEKRTYINITKHRVFARVVFLSDSFLSKLSNKDRKIVLEEAQIMAKRERQLAIDSSKIFLEILKDKGSVVNRWSEKKRSKNRELFKAAYDKYIRLYGSKVIDFINSIEN